MKLYISTSGLYEPIRYNISDAQSSLSKAMRSATNSPSGFSYSSYVNSLDTKIREYINELSYIDNTVRKSERNYSNTMDEYTRKVSIVNEYKISERNGVNQ